MGGRQARQAGDAMIPPTPFCKSCGTPRATTPTWTIKGALCNDCNRARMRECYYRRVARAAAGDTTAMRRPAVRVELHGAARIEARWRKVRRMSRAAVVAAMKDFSHSSLTL